MKILPSLPGGKKRKLAQLLVSLKYKPHRMKKDLSSSFGLGACKKKQCQKDDNIIPLCLYIVLINMIKLTQKVFLNMESPY